MANLTKVILNQTVAKLGAAGDVVEVKGGFARNYLLPRAIAAPWSKKAEGQIAIRRAAVARKAIASADAAKEIQSKLESTTLNVAVKAGKDGKLFGAVKGLQIAEAAKAQFGVEIDRRSVETEGVIKNLGASKAVIHLHDGIDAIVKLNITPASKK